jgi:hypothetical protein
MANQTDEAGHNRSGAGLVKLMIPLPRDAWHGYGAEWLWVAPTGGGYELRNIPFYAEGISFGDVVRGRHREGALEFTGIARHGGHSTYRIVVHSPFIQEDLDSWLAPLATLGCEFERATEHLWAIDVPPAVDIYKAYELIAEGKRQRHWDFEEGHCGHELSRGK